MTPPPSPTELTIRQAAELFRSGRLSPVELVAASLERAEETQPTLLAYVEIWAEEAMAAASRAETEIRARRDRGLLHGIPIAIKDIFDVQGQPTRCGSRARENVAPAIADAAPVARLREAGAIFVGKTVTQEFAAGVVSAPARNPWDPNRIPGGSSGGSATAVAVGSCLAALGSDTGGSIRIPAAATGVVGLKPTYGRVGKRGVFPLSWSFDTVGPLARTVEDAALVLNALAGHDPGDPTTAAVPVADAASALRADLRGVRLGVPRPHFFDRLQPDVEAAVDAAVRQLAELGAEVLDTPWPEAAAARAVGFIINRVETAAVHETMVRDRRDLLELLNPDLRLRVEAGALIPATCHVLALRAREVVKRSVARLFADHRLDALVVPTLPATAASVGDAFVRFADGGEPLVAAYTRLTMPFNATGQPAVSVPCGFDAVGLPIGLQIVGRPFDEAALCRIGHAYERASGWADRRPRLSKPEGG